jgi:dipeptidyl aminopeptidase/acylaminoacyl peptidase
LLLAAHHPDLVRAVVALYPVTDLEALAAHDYRFESGYTDWLVGDAYDRSPVHVADRVRAPVLLLQGDADAVVPPAQARMMVDALRRGVAAVENHVYEGEGHGWSRPETVADELRRTETFLARWAAPR